ncbi:MAG: bifunctional 23S rRNA (guanine(2069)-N(7))-methyltransferase RlmK/23S rRNA (guanine(2445)-N(2))-methyltransferase RlmL [Spirochaetes bacterium]|nr:bifunctional 23S rRNA (guanine(2069)-N(7))-methyltransferase RlmK/23S rRNA (guanine(2445)-N(2))-methyltransferase RlmL [Spirochaetota bacterium]
MQPLNLFASAPKGVEPILAEELRDFGAAGCRATAGGVHFTGSLAEALRACLWSRTASRIFLCLGESAVEKSGDMYDAARTVPWEDLAASGATMAVDFSGTGAGINNTMYGAQLVKDAVVDRIRDRRGKRPSIDAKEPDFLVNCHLSRKGLEVRVDLSGGGLHARGYRLESGAAPIRENLAAALLIKSGWPTVAGTGGSFLDPMCGSGTMVIEAALMAADIAPGLNRLRWGFRGWQGFDPSLWEDLVNEASERMIRGLTGAPKCVGFDSDRETLRMARHNAARARVETIAHFEKRLLEAAGPPPGLAEGLILTNPPYGKRMGDAGGLRSLYEELGDTLKKSFPGWRAAVITGEPELGKRMGLRAHKSNVFFNGPLQCRLLQFRVEPDSFIDREALDSRKIQIKLDRALERGAIAFMNRIGKNMKTTGKWAAREGITCYRIYDADLPEYAVAVDRYGEWVHVQEYAAPPSVDAVKAETRLKDALTVLPEALGVDAGRIILKVRRRQKGPSQYDKQNDRGEFIEVAEGPCRFLVNLTDYLDTGLFLDHRMTRGLIGSLAKGKRFCNLFCYTGTATVHAALGGARSTVSVDLSATYLDWARRNLELNDIRGARHGLEQADCREWIAACRERFDLVFLDPPTFSNSKRMKGSFDVQRDHGELINDSARLLAPGGTILFSTNRDRFKMDEGALKGLVAEDITAKTIPKDFERNPRIHSCWIIKRKS